MIKFYFQSTIRSFYKDKTFTFINLSGLVIGLSLFMAISLFFEYEISYDDHPSTQGVYRLILQTKDDALPNTRINLDLVNEFEKYFTEVEASAFVLPPRNSQDLVSNNYSKFYVENILTVQLEFFDMFPVEFIYGDKENSLKNLNQLVVTESISKILFGNKNPIGELIQINDKQDYYVGGVIKDPPMNSHMSYDILKRYDTNLALPPEWHYEIGYAYVKINSPENLKFIKARLNEFINSKSKFPIGSDYNATLIIQPVSEIYLYPRGKQAGSNKRFYLNLFLGVSLLILITAVFNYLILENARSLNRTLEFGIKKTLGAERRQIFLQMIIESLFTISVSLLISIILLYFLSPFVYEMVGIEIDIIDMLSTTSALVLALLLLTLILIISFYTVIFLYDLKPIQIIRSEKIKFNISQGSVKKVLIVLQFAISLTVITSTLFIQKQIKFTKDYSTPNLENPILVLENDFSSENFSFDLFKQQIINNSSIVNVTSGTKIGSPASWATYRDKNGDEFRLEKIMASTGYIDLFKLNLTSGRDFSIDNYKNDSTKFVLINELAANRLDISGASGQYVTSPINAYLVGIVSNFNGNSIYQEIEPTVIELQKYNSRNSYVFIEINKETFEDGINYVNNTWNSFSPNFPLRYTFYDELVEIQYFDLFLMNKLLWFFSALSFIVAALGLYGLASYSAIEQKKNFGIRKVLGASPLNIFITYSNSFIKLVTTGFAFSLPISWYVVSNWLQNFVHKIDLNLSSYLIALITLLVITYVVLSVRIIQTVLVNPIEFLRND